MHKVPSGGTQVVMNGDGVREVCCDCDLTHFVIYRVIGRPPRIVMTIYRDEAETRRLRAIAERRKRKKEQED